MIRELSGRDQQVLVRAFEAGEIPTVPSTALLEHCYVLFVDIYKQTVEEVLDGADRCPGGDDLCGGCTSCQIKQSTHSSILVKYVFKSVALATIKQKRHEYLAEEPDPAPPERLMVVVKNRPQKTSLEALRDGFRVRPKVTKRDVHWDGAKASVNPKPEDDSAD